MTDESIFAFALAISNPHERAAYLDQVCAGKPGLRQEVEDLLAAHAGSNLLDRPPADLGRTGAYSPANGGSEPTAAVGDRVGPYKLLEKIGEGGMGEVWVADQLEPIKRRVAIKLIKPGMDSRSVLGRFEAERQALAVMDHPNIAKVLDAGTTPDGRPYFVMELVKGTPITEFADARTLTPRQRLELFVPVCQAIQHAHMKGIIHRDIKPSNVLVALHDETPVPKVIDFGVAKAVGQQLTEKTIYTGFGALVGTPAYMAPEQATFNQLDVDTRADVYALGVLLYELLAGSPPIENDRLKKAALDEVLRIVRDEEPPRPSARLSTSQARASIAATRGSEPEKLSALMKGELDWIVMKALEKDRARRYETANGFAADVQRYLAGEQVQAVPPSLGYRVRKAYRRNRVAVWVATAFSGLIAGAAVMGAYLAVQAKQAERVAEKNADAFFGAMTKANDAVQQLELTAMNQRVDADLTAINKHPRPHTGLLRLARTLKEFPQQTHRHYPLEGGGEIVFRANPDYSAKMKTLQEFLTVAILAAGQEFGLLLPPMTHDGHQVTQLEISSDGCFIVTLGSDHSARLWDLRTTRQLAVLQEANETVVRCGFSPDGKTAFTDDDRHTVRLWDGQTGRYRTQAKTSFERIPKADKFYRDVAINDGRLLTSTRYIDWGSRSNDTGDLQDTKSKGLVGLWDTVTGHLIALLDGPHGHADKFQFQGTRWISAIDKSTVVLFSTEDGQEVARLPNPSGVSATEVLCSPDGNWMVTKYGDFSFRIWRTADWHAKPAVSIGRWAALRVLNDGTVLLWDWRDGMTCAVYHPRGGPVTALQGSWSVTPGIDHLVPLDDGRIADTKTSRLIQPSDDAESYTLLSRFAPDGRFALSMGMDALTGKALPIQRYWSPQVYIQEDRFWWEPMAVGNIHGFGQVAVAVNYRVEVRLIPPLDQLAIPAEHLELWLQVALRGELGATNEYVKWDEPTWEKRRQLLAEIPPPIPNLPFPGYLATDKLHWLRTEYQGDWLRNNVEGNVNKAFEMELATLLLSRSQMKRDQSEITRWKHVVSSYEIEVAPAPRAVK